MRAEHGTGRAVAARPALRRLAAIFAVSVMDLLQRPIIILLLYTTVILIALMPFVPFLTLGEENRLVRDACLSLVLLFGLAVAVYAAATCLYRELREGAGELVLCKPVGRLTFLAAKYLAVAAVIGVYLLATGPAFLISSRASRGLVHVDWHLHLPLLLGIAATFGVAAILALSRRRNFRLLLAALLPPAMLAAFLSGLLYRPPYSISAGFGLPYLAAAVGGVALALLTVGAVTVTLSTRLPLPLCAVFTLLLMVVGVTAENVSGGWALLRTCLIPDWMNFWILSTLPPASPRLRPLLAADLAFTFAFGAALFILGWWLFRNQEIMKRAE